MTFATGSVRPRTLAIAGGATLAGGVVLQQLIAYGGAALAYGGPQLDQSMLQLLYTVASVIGAVAIPLGAAILGAGIALHLAARGGESDVATGARTVDEEPLGAEPLTEEPADWHVPGDARLESTR